MSPADYNRAVSDCARPIAKTLAATFAPYAGTPPRRRPRPALPPLSRENRLARCPAVAYFDGKPSVVSIIAIVAAFYGLHSADLIAPCRRRPIARPRHVAMYLALECASFGRPILGCIFRRDRQTIFHGHANIARLLGEDASLAADVAALRAHILAADATGEEIHSEKPRAWVEVSA